MSRFPSIQQAPGWTQALKQIQRLDACMYVPGVYRLPNPPATPIAILRGSHTTEPGCVEFFPRRPDFCGRPSMSIPFSVHGHPAPYLKDILKDRVLLDGAYDAIMADEGWSRTKWLLEWPGYNNPPRGLVVAGLNRTALAKEIATCVAIFLHDATTGPAPLPAPLGKKSPWSANNVHFGDVRLVALNYYNRVWVPVLAFDIP